MGRPPGSAVGLRAELPETWAPERAWVLGALLSHGLGMPLETVTVPGAREVRLRAGEGPTLVFTEGLFGAQVLEPIPGPVRDWPLEGDLQERLGADRLPLLSGPAPEGALVLREEGGLRFQGDLLGTAFLLLSRLEECGEARDAHDRFPAAAMAHVKAGLHLRPLVDEIAEVIAQAAERLWPGLPARRPAFGVALSHDVDLPSSAKGVPFRRMAVAMAKDVLWRRAYLQPLARLASLLRDGEGDPNREGLRFLWQTAERRGLRTTSYFIATEDPLPIDGHHRMEEPWLRKLVAEGHDRGHRVGLHPSYRSYRDPARLARERARLAAAAGRELGPFGARQHYLRWRPQTFAHYAAAGLTHDGTLGFPDRLGFRCGTARPYPAFDLEARRELPVRVEPLHFMDAAFFEQERHMFRIREQLETLAGMAARVRHLGGTLSLLWHNDYVASPRERALYLDVLRAAGAP